MHCGANPPQPSPADDRSAESTAPVNESSSANASSNSWGIDRPLKLLLVEDSPLDAELITTELKENGFIGKWIIVKDEKDYLEKLTPDLDLILSDYSLPRFNGFRALALLQERDLDIPFIIVSGTIDQDTAVTAIKLGANDYLLKDRLRRLGPAVKRALEEKALRVQKQAADAQLRKLSRAVEQSPASIIICNRQGIIEYVNPRCEQVSGYTAAELIGQTPRILKGGQTPQETYQTLWNTVSAGGEWSGDLHNRKKNGELFWEHVAISPIRDASGQVTHYLAIKEDITEKRMLEERFLRAQRMENIGRLAGGIAHDLNNILAPIMMSIQMLRELFNEPAAEGILDVIQASAQRGADIVKQVLAFGRGMEGRQIEMQANSIVREVVAMLEQTFPKSIQTNYYCSPSLRTILADPTQIHQVLLNLCVNSKDAMPDGGSIEIRSSNVLIDEHSAHSHPNCQPGPYVLIEVIDTGTGIPEEIRAKIFDPFFTTKEVGKGTGLGLSTSFGIVQNHGGFMDVLSTPGEGTTFKIFLPAAPAGAGVSAAAPEFSLPRGNDELILIVDDEVPIRMIAKRILSSYGYRCLTASNGKEAISLYNENRSEVAAVITDLVMPVMDGPALIRALRQINPTLKVIAASGVLMEDHADHASFMVEEKVNHFILKPFSTQALLETLSLILKE